ncbi:O-acyltransferase WSD1-like isoform X4 [Vitis riparia]|uniref:O-acyltransferase WSD1-like isoform X4 n=1 Tax=Vitis riparia TaxID=96939 RepID=UPI00155B345E|nr:O-acyltransferase WSD1-like isoform X4 [Vitis riparia]
MEPVGDLDSKQQALKPIQTKRSAAREVEGDGKKPEDIKEEEEEGEALSPVGRIFHETCFNVYVIAIAGFKIRINVDVVKANLEHSLLKHPRFSSLQVKDVKKDGGMKWVPTKVDLDKHIIIPSLHHTISSPDKMVEDYISNLSKTYIDYSKPLWELHILNIKTSDAESVAVFRIHHSLGDGMSLMSLVLACSRQISNPKALPTLPAKKTSNPDPVKSGRIWWTIRLVWNTIIDVLMFLATTLFLKDTMTPLSNGWKKGGGHVPRRFVYRTVSLDDIKQIKNGMKTTINDVVMGVSLAGLSRYLNRRYGETKEDKGAIEKKNNLPKNIRLRATLMMNIRPSPGLHVAAFLYHRVMNHTTICFSNVVGPMEEIGFYGHPMAFLAPSIYGQAQGLMIHFQSYINKMTFVLSVDEEIIPDPNQLCDDLEESLKFIKDAVIARGLV